MKSYCIFNPWGNILLAFPTRGSAENNRSDLTMLFNEWVAVTWHTKSVVSSRCMCCIFAQFFYIFAALIVKGWLRVFHAFFILELGLFVRTNAALLFVSTRKQLICTWSRKRERTLDNEINFLRSELWVNTRSFYGWLPLNVWWIATGFKDFSDGSGRGFVGESP